MIIRFYLLHTISYFVEMRFYVSNFLFTLSIKAFLLPVVQIKIEQLWLPILNAVVDHVTVKLHHVKVVCVGSHLKKMRLRYNTMNTTQAG